MPLPWCSFLWPPWATHWALLHLPSWRCTHGPMATASLPRCDVAGGHSSFLWISAHGKEVGSASISEWFNHSLSIYLTYLFYPDSEKQGKRGLWERRGWSWHIPMATWTQTPLFFPSLLLVRIVLFLPFPKSGKSHGGGGWRGMCTRHPLWDGGQSRPGKDQHRRASTFSQRWEKLLARDYTHTKLFNHKAGGETKQTRT